MKKDEEILQSLIAGGLIGAALGTLLSKDNDDTTLGAIAGAAILATLKANENAQKTNVPVYVEEQGSLYEINSNGEKRFIKTINKSAKKVPEHFKLK